VIRREAELSLHEHPLIADLLALLSQKMAIIDRARLAEPVGQGRHHQVLPCAAPGCGEQIVSTAWGQPKRYCSRSCQMKTYRARVKARREAP